jgi:xanthine dehydrogenase YagR molybdenum-binding subunit
MASIGQPIDRVEGRAKVTGRAHYTTERPVRNAVHAVLLTSTIPRGRVLDMDTGAAGRVPGLLTIMTPANAPRLPRRKGAAEGRVLQLLQDNRVLYANQPIGVVVADTLEAAQEAAQLVQVTYAPEPHEVRLEASLASAYTPEDTEEEAEETRGDVAARLAEADVRIEHVYTTPFETHHPMELHATVAVWDGPKTLTLHDGTQNIFGCRDRVARLLGLPRKNVRVISEYLGGGFGSKGPTWSHVVLAAMAARRVDRPVKLALTRAQTSGPIGGRPRTRQSIALGARRDGTLTALRHDTVAQTSTFDEYTEECSTASRMLYAVANCATSHKLVRSDIGTPSYMRAPGWAPGTYALECAMDEMACALGLDPLAFRLKNYAERHPHDGRPWSLKALRECYDLGAERFGWAHRPLEPGTLRDGHVHLGWGMATSVYPTYRSAAGALARLQPDGTVVVEAGTHDLGTGTYTIMTQIAADALALPPERVVFRLGDTSYPETPESGGSQTAASVGSAVHAAAAALRKKLERRRVKDWRRSPGARPIETRVESAPGDEEDRYAMYAFGAQFVEVRVDTDLGQMRVSRMVGVFDCGRILNPKTARSQLAGGMVGGIGMALHEATVLDERLGRVVNNNLAEYHLPVNLDVPAIDVTWIDRSDARANPLGVKGIGEIGITGAAAAVANAVFHATGTRVRDLPITLDTLLGSPASSVGSTSGPQSLQGLHRVRRF